MDTQPKKSIDRRIAIIATIIAVAGSLCAVQANIMGNFGKSLAPFSVPLAIAGSVIAFVVILNRPINGLIVFMLYYPLVSEGAGISPMELVSAVMIAGFIAAYAMRRQAGGVYRDFFGAEKALVLFGVYLCLNSVPALIKGTQPIDIIRDIVPIANLAMFPVVIRLVRTFPKLQKLVRVQVGVLLLVGSKLSLMSTPAGGIAENIPGEVSALGMISLLIIGAAGILFGKSGRLRKWYYLLCVMPAIYLVATPTRTHFLAALGGVALMVVLTRSSRRAIGLTILASVVFATAYLLVAHYESSRIQYKIEKLQSTFSGSDLSIMSRKDEARQCWRLFLESPVIGVGIGYRYRFWRHYVQGIGAGVLENNFTHSDFMNLLAKLGLAGTVLFGLFYYRMLKLAWMLYSKGKQLRYRSGGLTGFVILVIALITGQSTPVLQVRSAALFLAFVMAYIFCIYREMVSEKEAAIRDTSAQRAIRGTYAQSSRRAPWEAAAVARVKMKE